MKFSENWLRELVEIKADRAALAHALTMAGLEVEELTVLGEQLSGVVVAEIVAAEKHPEADRLQVCKVNAGQGELLQIVCGAPNARVGIKVPLAMVGANLPGGIAIKAAKLRGVESFGMLCSAKELGIDADASGLLELPLDAPVGKPLADYLGLPDAATRFASHRHSCLYRHLHRAAEQCGHVVREADQAKTVGTVRRELQLEAGVGQPQIIGQRLAHRRIERQFQQTRGVGVDAQLLGRAQHAGRLDATQLRRLDPDAARQRCTDRGQRHLDAHARVRRATDDLQRPALPRIHLANLQPVGFRVLFGSDDFGHHHTSQAFAQRREFLHLQPGHGQRMGQLGAVGLDLDQLAQPVLGKFHARGFQDAIRRTA